MTSDNLSPQGSRGLRGGGRDNSEPISLFRNDPTTDERHSALVVSSLLGASQVTRAEKSPDMGLVSREIRRLRIRADCFRILARHAEGVVKRTELLEMAEVEDKKIVEAELQNEAGGDPASIENHRQLSRQSS